MEDRLKQVIVIYGTCSGNAELVAEAITTGISDKNIPVRLTRVEQIKLDEAKHYGLLVLISSTWNVGKLQDYFEPFYAEMIKSDLSEKPIAVVGLGDSQNYDIFCGAADYLEEATQKSGAYQIVETLRIDGPPHARLDEYRIWGNQLGEEFLRLQVN